MMSELQQKHYEYKILTKDTFPTEEEHKNYLHTNKLNQYELENRAQDQLQKEVTQYLNQGWKLTGNFTSTFVENIPYHSGYDSWGKKKYDSIQRIRFSQSLVLEEDYPIYQARIKREEEKRIAAEKRKEEQAKENARLAEERIQKEIEEGRRKAAAIKEAERMNKEKRQIQEETERVEQERLAKEAERKSNMIEFREHNGFDTSMGRECTVWGPSRFRNGYTIMKGGRIDWCCHKQITFQFPEDESLICANIPFPTVCPLCLARLCSKPSFQDWNYLYVNFFEEFTCNKCGKYRYNANSKKHYVDNAEWDPEDPTGSKAREQKSAEEKAKILAQIAELNAKLLSV